MPLTIWNCVLSYKQKKYFSEIWLAFLRNCFPGNSQVATFYYPRFLTGGKSDFQVANLLLATANFEPCMYKISFLHGKCKWSAAIMIQYFSKAKIKQ